MNSPTAAPGPASSPSPRRPGGRIVLLVLLLLIFALFLIFPFDSLTPPAWVPALQAQFRAGFSQIGPYLLVAFLGAIVGLAEISATFSNYPREALQTRWARILVLVNAAAAALAFLLARVYAPTTNLILLIVMVGIGFQALIRTRFTLAKQLGDQGKEDITVNLGWVYDQFQHLCKTQIDLELMNGRRTAVTRLLECFPTLAELYDIAQYTVISRATLSPEEEKARLAELEKLFAPSTPSNYARPSIALFILENGGQAYVELLLDQSIPAQKEELTANAVVKRLIDSLTLEALVDLANKLLTNQQERDWVAQAAQPAPDASQASQKAAIAHFLVERVGAETVAGELGSRGAGERGSKGAK